MCHPKGQIIIIHSFHLISREMNTAGRQWVNSRVDPPRGYYVYTSTLLLI